MTNVEPLKALNLDINQQQSFVRFYKKLPQKTGSTVRFFNHSDYYTVHAEDATFVSQQVFNSSVIKYMGQEPKLSYAVLSRSNFEKFVRELLLIKQYRVEVYIKPSQSKNVDWSLQYKGSPGNLSQFEDILFENSDIVINTAVMGIKLFRGNKLAISCVNTTESHFYVNEIDDNEFFTELEALIAQIGPKECLIPTGESADLGQLNKVLERNGVLVVKIKSSDFHCEDIVQDLNRLLYFVDKQQRNSMAFAETKMKEAMGSLQAVVKYLNLTADDQHFNQFKLSSLDIHRFVRLDSAALNALNLFPVLTAGASNKFNSIFGVLDNCATSQGRRLLDQWLKQPLRDINVIEERLEIVETFVNDSNTRTTLATSSLSRFPDLLILAKKLCTKKITLQDCYRIYQTVYNMPGLIDVLRKTGNKCIQSLLVEPIGELLVDMEKYQSMIEQTLDLDLVDRGEYLIKPSFDEELEELHQNKQNVEEKMQKLLRKAASDLNIESGKIKLECTDQHGYFFRVTLKEEQALRQNKQYEIIDAIKGGVRFTVEKLKDFNSTYSKYNEQYQQAQKNVVNEIYEIAAGYGDTLRNLNLCIAKIDVLVSLATSAANAPIPYVRPKILPEGSGILKIKKARHACLERIDDTTFIPNDISLNKDEIVLNIITGPNMGGKSTYMRTVGVCVLLAHIGSLVPCESAEISMVDCILSRVGADDCELKGMSTFMLEMVETCGIVRSASSKSLVIIDELGRGTSTYDGCGIAFSLAEFLAKQVKCFTLFATHFHEITKLEETLPNVLNLHVTALVTASTITPLYQIRKGICDKSYGVHCARTVEFSEDVIQMAEKQQKELEDYEGMKYIKDYEVSLKRKAMDEGDLILKEALDLLKYNIQELSDEELMAKLKKFKSDLESQDNLFVKGLIENL